MERKWVVCAFGDIRGFGSWTSRAANSRESKDPYIEGFYALMDAYVRTYRDVYFKRVGDGFMALKELEPTDSRGVAAFLLTLRCITRKARAGIYACRYPKPDGFRIRITCGDVYKLMVLDPNDPERQREIPEYIEYPTNAAAHLLVVNPQSICLATEGVVRALGRRRSVFRCRKLGTPSCYPKSVNREDVDTLQLLQF